MRENKQNNPQPTNPLLLKMQNITDFLNLPFIEVLKLVMKGAVEDYLTESGVLAALAAIPAKATKKDNEGLNAEEALDFLNANGYPIKKGQLYKETSANTIPHKKFGNKLHFKAQELLAWAESKLIDGNAVGVLDSNDKPKKKGGRR